MAKSVKKSSPNAAKQAPGKNSTKKSAKKAVAKSAKKSAKKALVKPAKKTTKIAAKTPQKGAPKKAVKKAAKKSSSSPAKIAGKTFLVIYHAPLDAFAQTANVSPEQQAEGMALWQAWAERCGEKLLDMGAPLMNGMRLGVEGEPTSSTKEVAGYSLLSAEDWDDVMSLLEGHPHISGWYPGATIEIHETMEMPGM